MSDKKSTKKPFPFEFKPDHKPFILITITAPTPTPTSTPDKIFPITSQNKARQRSTSRTKKSTSHHSSLQQPQWNGNTEVIVVEDDNGKSDKLFAKIAAKPKTIRKHSISSSSETSSSLSHRPPFNLDTHIDGYDDVDENGKYRKKQSSEAAALKTQIKKSQINQQELNEQWAESLRDNFYH